MSLIVILPSCIHTIVKHLHAVYTHWPSGGFSLYGTLGDPSPLHHPHPPAPLINIKNYMNIKNLYKNK